MRAFANRSRITQYVPRISLSLLAVVADRFDRTTFKRFNTELDIFSRLRLSVYEGVPSVFVTGKEIRCSFTAKIAVDALFIHIELAGNILGPFFVFFSHSGSTGYEFLL